MSERLTPAEWRVLRRMAGRDGRPAARTEMFAALDLGLSSHTVHTTLRNVRSKLGAHSTREAVAMAFAVPRSGVAAAKE